MSRISVIIITYNEENNIAECILSAKKVSNDIIVVDCHSNDRTISLAKELGAKIFVIEWNGYGHSRNFGALQAANDWILALDADERISDELAESINRIPFTKEHQVYKFGRENYLTNEKIRFGTLGFETVKRLYNRQYCKWDLTPVHEKLIGRKIIHKQTRGKLLHYGLKDADDYRAKAKLYAQLSAEKYFLQGRKRSMLKKFSSPVFNSVKSLLFQLGFLDGKRGLIVAAMIAYYSWLKYHYLTQLLKQAKTKDLTFILKSKMKAAS